MGQSDSGSDIEEIREVTRTNIETIILASLIITALNRIDVYVYKIVRQTLNMRIIYPKYTDYC